jgi:uncharacterized protein (DUF2267 family)
MSLNFDSYAQKGNLFLKELAEELGNKKDTERAGRILRAVFSTLRNHITPEESFQLMSQLPMALKSVYVTGWSPAKEPVGKIKSKHDFITEVITEDGRASQKDFPRSTDGENAVKAVFRTLKNYVSYGEFEDIMAVMPKEIKELIAQSIEEKKTIIL